MKINQSSVKAYALQCSKELRAGKFERVSQAFLEEVEAEVERLIRSICGVAPERFATPPDGTVFVVQSEVMPHLLEKLNTAVTHVIARKVHRHPSVGKTLMPLNS